MTNAAKLFAKDEAKRRRLGWPGISFIAPSLSAPRTKAEKAVRDVLAGKENNAHMLHIYRVIELMEMAYERGRKECQP